MSFGQGGPGWGPGGSSTPDWAALADQAERSRTRRRRWFLLGGGAFAAAAVATAVTVAVVNGGGGSGASDKPSHSLPTATDLPSDSPQPDPSFKDEPPPPPPPRDFVADAKHDKAPLSNARLFHGDRAHVGGRSYRKHATDTTSDCASVAHGKLGPVLTAHHCRKVYRATYTRGQMAVTIGIAVFEDSGTAAAVKHRYQPNVKALPGSGVSDFCRTVTCRTAANSYGRYAYFSIAGHADGDESGSGDKQAVRSALDGLDYAYARILQRGKDQAKASVTTSSE